MEAVNRDEAVEARAFSVEAAPAPFPSPTPYAGLASRGLAFIIDMLILTSLIGGSTFVGNLLIRELADGDLTKQFIRVIITGTEIALPFIYIIGFWVLAGQTPGKAIMGLRIVTADKAPLTVGRAALRFFGYLPSSFLLLGFLWVLIDPRRRALHDKLAGTVVVFTSRPVLSSATQPSTTREEPSQ